MKYYFDANTNTHVAYEDVVDDNRNLVEITEDCYLELTAISAEQVIVTDSNLPLILPVKSYYYSAIENAFYPAEMQVSYKNSGSWPDKGKWVDESVFTEFAISPAPEGKMRVVGKNGLPKWGDLPKPTKEQLIAEAEQKKQSLLAEANNAIAPLQDAIDLGMATEAEAAALQEWKKYRVLLNRVDTSTAPDVEWPEKP
ncbi:phage tail protein [Providencia heimbachae]|uniref:tail fiber assembly protein n=1 Tax=Providencia heimbachae TaxID=333962 RepID=UPI0010BF3EC9|nr:phage tail protein [Providencia heimbachae]